MTTHISEMWTVFIFLNLGVLHCTVSSSPPIPVSVVFSSVNLRNVLQWYPGDGTPWDTLFTVQYAIYGDSVEGSKGKRVHWRAVHQCTNIVQKWCDLTNETWDHENGYYGRVRAVSRTASSKWALTPRRFDPTTDTIFGPPLVYVEIDGDDAVITLEGPMRYQPNNNTPLVSMATLYPQMTYTLSIHNGHHNQTHHFPQVSNPYKFRLMEYETKYCFFAKATFLSMPALCQYSEWHCITTPTDPATGRLLRVVWGIVAITLCICVIMLLVYCLHNYLTGKGLRRPRILNGHFSDRSPLPFPPVDPKTIISIIKDEPPPYTNSVISDPPCPNHKAYSADPPPQYSPQRPETPLELQEPWDNLSIDYGFIGGAVGGEEEGRERSHDRGDDGSNGKCQKCIARDNNETQESRVEDGHSAGVYSPEAKSYRSQTSTNTCMQTHMPIHSQIHTQTEMSTHVQAQAWSQLSSVPLTQIRGSLQSFQGASEGEVDREREDRGCPGIFLKKNPQTGLLHNPLHLQTKKEVGVREEMDGKVHVRTDREIEGAAGEGSESERVVLLSAYASQNIKHMPTSHTNQLDFLPNDYGFLSPATAHSTEEDDEEEEETTCINWDPETRKLLLPEMAMEFKMERSLGGLMPGEEGYEERLGGRKEEKANTAMGGLKLENVFVRQASEEEAEALRGMEAGGETGWEEDDILTKWNLVISMDE